MKRRKNNKTNKNVSSRSEEDEFLEMSVGSSNAFEATERPDKDKEKELSDEKIDEMIDEEDNK